MRKQATPLILIFLFLCTFSFATELPPGFEEDLLVYRLVLPVSAEYAPDGRLFILEKPGRIRIFKDGQLLRQPFLKLQVDDLYERGLLGFAFDPDFVNNHYVYIYRTAAGASPQNVVERYTADEDMASATTRLLLLNGIHSDTGVHNAGCLRFGKDGKLYIATGDGGLNPNLSQDLSNLNGKILRINPDGTVPFDNPFVNQQGARPEIWCYGLRNPWRFAIHPKSALIVIGDVGADLIEEVNLAIAGANFGWPLAEGPSSDPRFANPVHSYSHEGGSAAVVAGVFYTGTKFPLKYQQRFFFADYARDFIKAVRFDSNNQLASVLDFAQGLESSAHMLQGPDQSLLYVSVNTGEIRRIQFVGGTNRQPAARAFTRTRSGLAPLTVRFRSDGTSDPDGDPLHYLWDFGDGSTSTDPNPIHVYSKKGIFFALLKATDSKESTAIARSIKITVGNLAPVATILTPEDGTVVHLGQVVSFSGKGFDAEDGMLSGSNLYWSARLHHNDHTHPVFGQIRGASGSFPVPSVFHGSGTLFFRLKLVVVDSAGLSGIDYVDLPLHQ